MPDWRNVPAPPTNAVPESVQCFDVGRHSEKPEEFYGLIEAMTAGLSSRLEMFARGVPRPGWVTWGNQADAREAA